MMTGTTHSSHSIDSPTSQLPDIGDLVASARRGVAWILAQQRIDGSFCAIEDGVGSYYKVPSTLAVAGEWRAAHRLLTWVAANHLTAEGDFRAAQRRAHEPIHEAWPVYANAWLIQGAQRVGRWDVAQKGMEYLKRLQVAGGSFYTLDGAKPFMEPVALSWGGLAALTTGNLYEARRAGDQLVRMVDLQPDPTRFYYRLDETGTLITDYAVGSELNYFVDSRRTKQIYYNPGIALIFLCQLYLATAEQGYLTRAQTIFQFTERCAADVHRFPPSGKLGLGSALLYRLTGNAQAQRAALSVAAYLIETQSGEGVWRLPNEEPYSSLQNRDSFDVLLDITAEFTVFLLEMAANL